MGAVDHNIRITGATSPAPDYTTLTAWEADLPADFSGHGVHRALLWNDWSGDGLYDSVTIGGQTNVSSADHPEIVAASGTGQQGANRHNGTWNSGARVYHDASGGRVVNFGSISYCKIDGVQVYHSLSAFQQSYGVYSYLHCTVQNCLIRSNGTYNLGAALKGAYGGFFYNNACICPSAAVCIDQYYYSSQGDVFHCSTYGGSRGISSSGNVKECSAYGSSSFDFYGTPVSASYNASEDGTAPGTNPVTLTANPYLDSGANDLRIGSGSQLTDAGGTTGAGVSTDCIGTARPQNTNYDIGWFEYLAAGGGTEITPAIGALAGTGVAGRNDRGVFVPTEVDA